MSADLNNSLAEYPAALKAAQKENFKLLEELKKATLQANTETVQQSDDVKKRDLIAKLGRQYSIMICPWIETSVFDNLNGRPDVDPASESRYSSKASMASGTVAELYDFVPSALHEVMENQSSFVSTFRTSVQGQRSNAILSVRQRGGLLFGLKQDYFETSFDRKSVPELQALLKMPGRDDYAIFAPILFENGKYHPRHKGLFKNILLPRVAKCMLFGRSSTTSKPQTLAEIWKVTKATPGLIAFSSIVVRFLISPDEELRKVGKITRIKWAEEFNSYKQILTGNAKKVQDVIAFFDEHVFGVVPNVPAVALEPDVNDMELRKAIDAFRADESDSESESESDGDGTTTPDGIDDENRNGNDDSDGNTDGNVTPSEGLGGELGADRDSLNAGAMSQLSLNPTSNTAASRAEMETETETETDYPDSNGNAFVMDDDVVVTLTKKTKKKKGGKR